MPTATKLSSYMCMTRARSYMCVCICLSVKRGECIANGYVNVNKQNSARLRYLYGNAYSFESTKQLHGTCARISVLHMMLLDGSVCTVYALYSLMSFFIAVAVVVAVIVVAAEHCLSRCLWTIHTYITRASTPNRAIDRVEKRERESSTTALIIIWPSSSLEYGVVNTKSEP